jgi:hypothetical protein
VSADGGVRSVTRLLVSVCPVTSVRVMSAMVGILSRGMGELPLRLATSAQAGCSRRWVTATPLARGIRPEEKGPLLVVGLASIPYATSCLASSSGLQNRLTTR